MSAAFAFQPYGLSQAFTVGAAAPVTTSLSVQGVGQASAQALTGGNFIPKCLRISNAGTAAAFINFGATAAAVSVSPTIGMMVRNGTDVIVRPGGAPFLAMTCASTFTVTLSVTPGEGI